MLLNAQDYVNERLEILRKRVSKLKQTPKLAIIRVGDDYASGKYVQNKVKRCKEVGMHSEILHFEENVTQAELIRTIFDLNRDRSVTGVLLQLPLPKHLDENHLTSLIHYDKDVDGFNEINMGKLVLGEEGNVACTREELYLYYVITT